MSTEYIIGNVSYNKDDIISMHRQIQSEHDRTKNRDFTDEELAIKDCYKRIQGERDSLRIRALKAKAFAEHTDSIQRGQENIDRLIELTPFQIGDTLYSVPAIIEFHKQIQSLHSRNPHLAYTGVELQIEQWYRAIQSQRDSLRKRRLVENQIVADEIQTDNMDTEIDTTPSTEIGEVNFDTPPSMEIPHVELLGWTQEMICRKKSEIQSLHDKYKSLAYTPFELAILNEYKKIQSSRDSERFRELNRQRRVVSSVADKKFQELPTTHEFDSQQILKDVVDVLQQLQQKLSFVH